MVNRLSLSLSLLLLSAVVVSSAKHAPKAQKKKLERSDGKRWKRLGEVVKAQITSQTQKFLQNRGQSLFVPINVDVLLLGMEGDGAFHYHIDPDRLLEVLVQSHHDICPTVWDTGEQAAVCFSVNYEMLTTPDEGLQELETVMRDTLLLTRPTGSEVPRDGLSAVMVPVYDIEASGKIESTIASILDKAYLEGGIPLPGNPKSLAEHRVSIVLMNPSKLRMSPLTTAEEGERLSNLNTNSEGDGLWESWVQGMVSTTDLVTQEAGFVYRYKYNGRGGAGTWVSSHNFVVIDISAGPSDYGPLTTPDGHVTPVELPRILPMFVKMAKDIEDHGSHPGTMREHLLEEASEGQHVLQQGALAELMASATHHIFCPDVKMSRIEHAAQVLVPIIAIHDDESFDAVSGASDMEHGFEFALDLVAVQAAMDMMVDSKQYAVQEVQTVMLHHHRNVATALHKAKVTRSTTVISSSPGVGLMRSQHVHLDSEVLLRELLMASPMLSDGALDVIDPDEMEQMIEDDLAQHVRHLGTRVVPVFLLSLSNAPDQLMLDHNQLVAANRDAVVVMQMKPPEGNSSNPNEDSDGYVNTRHMLNGKHVKLHAAAGVTANVMAGLAMSLAGIVPPYERYNAHEGAILQDWRWSHGAMPWGPYSNSTTMSSIFSATARRNVFLSNFEAALHVLQKRLDEVDAFVAANLQGPFHFLEEEVQTKHGRKPPRHWLNVLANHSHGYNDTFSVDVVQRLESNLQEIEAKIEMIAWSIYGHDFDAAEDELPGLFAAVDLFSKHIKQDLVLAEDTMACCKLHHTTAAIDNLFIVLTVMVLLLCLLLLALVFVFFTGRRARRMQLPDLRSLGSSMGLGGGGKGSSPNRWTPLPSRSSPSHSPLNSARSWQQAPSSSPRNHLNV